MLFVSNEHALPRRLKDPSNCSNAERSSLPSPSLSSKLTSALHVSAAAAAAAEDSSIFTFDNFEADQERVLSHLLEDFYRLLDDRDVGGASAKRERQKLAGSSGYTVDNTRDNRGEGEPSFSFSTSAVGDRDGRVAENKSACEANVTNPSANCNAGLDPDTFVFNPYRPPRGAKYKEVLTMVNINEWALVRDACGIYEDYSPAKASPIAGERHKCNNEGESGTDCTSSTLSAPLEMDSSTIFIHVESESESLQRRAAYDNYMRHFDHRSQSNIDHTSTCTSGDVSTRKKKRDGGDADHGGTTSASFDLADASKQIAGIEDKVSPEELVDAILEELMKLDESDYSEGDEDDERTRDEKDICNGYDEGIRNDAATSASEVVAAAVCEGDGDKGDNSVPTIKSSATPPLKNELPAVDPLDLLRKAHRFGAPHRYGGVKINAGGPTRKVEVVAGGDDDGDATVRQQGAEVSQRGRVGIPIVFSPEPNCSDVRVANTEENGGAKTKEARLQQNKLTKSKKNDAPQGVVVGGGALEVVAVRKIPKNATPSRSLPPSSKTNKISQQESVRPSLTGENWDGSVAFSAFLRTKGRDGKESVGERATNGGGRGKEGSLPTLLKAPTRTRVRFDEDAIDRMNREVLQRALKAFGGQEKRGKELLHIAEGLNWSEAPPATAMGKLPNLHVHAVKKTGDTSRQGDAKRHTKKRVAPLESMAPVGVPESAPLLSIPTGSCQDKEFVVKGSSRKDGQVSNLGSDDRSKQGNGASLFQARTESTRLVNGEKIPVSVGGGGRAREVAPSVSYRGHGKYLAPMAATRSPTFRPNGTEEADPEQKLSFVARGGTGKQTRLPHPPPPFVNSGPKGVIGSSAGKGSTSSGALLPLSFDSRAARATTVDSTKQRAQVVRNAPSETCSPYAPIVRSAPAGGSALEVSNQRRVVPTRDPLPPITTKAKTNTYKGQRGVRSTSSSAPNAI